MRRASEASPFFVRDLPNSVGLAKHILRSITMKPTNSPTLGQPNPIKNVKSGGTLSHSKYFFVGWIDFILETDYRKGNPTNLSANTLVYHYWYVCILHGGVLLYVLVSHVYTGISIKSIKSSLCIKCTFLAHRQAVLRRPRVFPRALGCGARRGLAGALLCGASLGPGRAPWRVHWASKVRGTRYIYTIYVIQYQYHMINIGKWSNGGIPSPFSANGGEYIYIYKGNTRPREVPACARTCRDFNSDALATCPQPMQTTHTLFLARYWC